MSENADDEVDECHKLEIKIVVDNSIKMQFVIEKEC